MQVFSLRLLCVRKHHLLMAFLSMALIIVVNTQFAPVNAATSATISVSGTSNSISSKYIGANGDMGYKSDTLKDIGFNTWRIWNDITVFEPLNDTSYGALSPADIKANVNVIPWDIWDKNMGLRRSFFAQTKADGVKLMLSLRNTGVDHSASWMANPLKSSADNNEWWEHVFATVYWLNVRNDYHIDDFEVFNEPDNSGQGWKGTEADYLAFAKLTRDAIDYVYKTYLPNRTYQVLGPSVDYPNVNSDYSVSNGNGWLYDLLHVSPTPINAVSYHHYASANQMVGGIHYAHDQMQQAGHSDFPLWLTEWGSYDAQAQWSHSGDNDQPFAVRMINNLIEFSQPGSDHVDGSHYYIWQDGGDSDGILDQYGNKRTVYYALQLAVQALQGGKPTYKSSTSTSDLTAITTKDDTGRINLLVTNTNRNNSYWVNADISALFTGSGSSTIKSYPNNKDQASGPQVNNGQVQFTIPASAAVLIQVSSSS